MGEPLNVAWIWKIAADPATEPGGQVRPGVRAGGRARRAAHPARDRRRARHRGAADARARARRPSESWAARAKTDPAAAPGLTAMRSAARTQADPRRPVRPDRRPQPRRARPRRRRRARARAGLDRARPACSTPRLDPRTTRHRPARRQAALARLGAQPGRPARRLARASWSRRPRPPQFTPARPFTLAERRPPVRRPCRPTTGSSSCSRATAPPALRAAHFLAGLAIVAIEAAERDARRRDRRCRRAGIPTRRSLNALIKGLRTTRSLAPVTLDQLFDHVPVDETDDGPVVRQLAPLVPSPRRPSTRAQLPRRPGATSTRSRRTVGADDPAITAGRPRPAHLAHVGVAAGGRAPSSPRPGSTAINHGITAFANLIQTPPSGLTVTLTSRKADLPLSFNNETGQHGVAPDQVRQRQARVPRRRRADPHAAAPQHHQELPRWRPARRARSR